MKQISQLVGGQMVVSHRAVYFAIFAFFHEYSRSAYSQCLLSVLDWSARCSQIFIGCVSRHLILTAQAACTPAACTTPTMGVT